MNYQMGGIAQLGKRLLVLIKHAGELDFEQQEP